MRIATFLTTATLASFMASIPALAQDDACVRLFQIEGTKVLDRSTIVVTDYKKDEFTLHMSGVCVGLDRFSKQLTFRDETRMGCLARGDIIGYSISGQIDPVTIRGVSNQMSCTIGRITAGAPEELDDSES